MLGLVRTWKASKLARDTHILESTEVGSSQDTERLQANKGDLQPGEEGRGGTCLNTATKQASRGTHNLEIAEYEVRLQDTNKQAETDKKLGENPLSVRENSIYSITTYPHPWKCF